ncbi:MAG TPA: hypothetical protein IAB56_06715 [Candidatus Scybalousia intestinigallinarum]|nr:hypothetical protein [Candidatus Scybalousia intestinigallinarum]
MLNNSLKDTSLLILFDFNMIPYIFELKKDQENDEFYLYSESLHLDVKKIFLQPNCLMQLKDTEQVIHFGNQDELTKSTMISNIYIDPTIFETLVESDLLAYPMTFASMYHLPEESSCDYQKKKRLYMYSNEYPLV